MAELEKLGPKYRIALKIIKDSRFERLTCTHKGTYADDCIVQRVTQVIIVGSKIFECFLFFHLLYFCVIQHKCYIVGTCDRDLKRRIRKIPGVPIMFLSQHRYTVERMPDAYGAPK